LSKFPELAAHIGRVATLWTLVEVQLGQLLGTLLGADAENATTMYLALRGNRQAAMNAVARKVLNDEEVAEYTKLMKKVRETEGMRNDVVHAIWAIDHMKPGALLWLDPAKHVAFEIAGKAAMHLPAGPILSDDSWLGQAFDELRNSERAYRKAEFENI